MRIALPLILFVFWMAIAYSSFQRGDMGWAAFCLVAGVVLSVYRIRTAIRASKSSDPHEP